MDQRRYIVRYPPGVKPWVEGPMPRGAISSTLVPDTLVIPAGWDFVVTDASDSRILMVGVRGSVSKAVAIRSALGTPRPPQPRVFVVLFTTVKLSVAEQIHANSHGIDWLCMGAESSHEGAAFLDALATLVPQRAKPDENENVDLDIYTSLRDIYPMGDVRALLQSEKTILGASQLVMDRPISEIHPLRDFLNQVI